MTSLAAAATSHSQLVKVQFILRPFFVGDGGRRQEREAAKWKEDVTESLPSSMEGDQLNSLWEQRHFRLQCLIATELSNEPAL